MSVQPVIDQITLVLDGEWDVPTAPEFEYETSGITDYDLRDERGGGGGNGYC